jgi:amidophosphoribosyltransferase
LDPCAGNRYLNRIRSVDNKAIDDIFKKIYKQYDRFSEEMKDLDWIKENLPFAGELYLGHLRYGTFGNNQKSNVHPVMRENNWRTRNLVLAGNFNMTNVDEIFAKLIELGQHPIDFSDTITMLENIGHFLDAENQRLFDHYKKEKKPNAVISKLIGEKMDVQKVLADSSKKWDGGYVIAGLVGHGDAFVNRDPWGIRPAFYYADEEIVVAASERPAIQTVMNVSAKAVKEIKPGYAMIIKKNGELFEKKVREPMEKRACSFERIYFSRGNDYQIYHERKKLGELLITDILEAIDHDIDNTVFSYIPNTAETAFLGMMKSLEEYLMEEKISAIEKKKCALTRDDLKKIINRKPRVEKAILKDVKLRTFITEDKGRDDLVAHVYDITYDALRKGKDNLVIIDDSIVRGTTLKESILKILDRLQPKRIVVASSSPQIRYPDCYGIDMAKLSDFIAFRAAVNLLKERDKEYIIDQVYKKAKENDHLSGTDIINYVKDIYAPFSPKEISGKIAEMLSEDGHIRAEVRLVYQSIENLHKACPDNKGDWYFTGDYPTTGGNRVSNRSFINYIEGKNKRAY